MLSKDMPSLRPVPIKTKGKNFAGRVWSLLTVVREWEVIEDWYFRLPNGVLIIIPKGFIFDGASVPKPLWGLLSPVGLLLTAGLIHDFAYRYDYLWSIDFNGQFYKYNLGSGQKHWDDLFKQISVETNGMIITDQLSWLALRAFGFISWNENRMKFEDDLFPTKKGGL